MWVLASNKSQQSFIELKSCDCDSSFNGIMTYANEVPVANLPVK